MHIKRVTVIGWKSYRDKSGIKECSPGFNVVFGRNGSGKSNFFEAIRFVLSDDYTSVRRKDRHGLLHVQYKFECTSQEVITHLFCAPLLVVPGSAAAYNNNRRVSAPPS